MTISYECDEHGRQLECDVDEIGARTCPECGRHVELVTDPGVA